MLDLVLQQTVNGLALGMCYALVALGLTLVFGVLHLVNFAHGEFYMLGGAVVATLNSAFGVPYALAGLCGIAVVAFVAWVVDRATVRPVLDTKDGTITVLLATFAVSLLIEHSVLGSIGPAPIRVDGLSGSLEFGPVILSSQRALVLGAGVALLLALEIVLRRTTLGKRIRAVAQSPHAARVVGIRVESVRTITFVGASAIAGGAGALITPLVLFSPVMGQNIIINAFIIVVLGGMGNLSGAVICGLLLGVVEALASIVLPQQVASAGIYALLLVVLLVRPTGLFGRARA